jgi:hypothetical protein
MDLALQTLAQVGITTLLGRGDCGKGHNGVRGTACTWKNGERGTLREG